MRLWSIHPGYLDTKGLLALWRESLLAKKVLQGKTIGYKNHPQLKRFKALENPISTINIYLSVIYEESIKRGYNFDKNKFNQASKIDKIPVTTGQIEYEKNHLLKKLKLRDKSRYDILIKTKIILAHPIFNVIDGKIEEWEIV